MFGRSPQIQFKGQDGVLRHKCPHFFKGKVPKKTGKQVCVCEAGVNLILHADVKGRNVTRVLRLRAR